MQLASSSQVSPVSLSVMVPSPLSVNLGFGHATPFSKSPSSPVAYDVVCPVFGTGVAPSAGQGLLNWLLPK